MALAAHVSNFIAEKIASLRMTAHHPCKTLRHRASRPKKTNNFTAVNNPPEEKCRQGEPSMVSRLPAPRRSPNNMMLQAVYLALMNDLRIIHESET